MLRIPRRCPKLEGLIAAMERLAPLKFADTTWDNVGLILESSKKSSSTYKVLVTVDLTESVSVEAVEKGVDAIIAYHPPWFRPAKSLTMEVGKEGRNLAFLASHSISVYSPHTALDNVRPGINDYILPYLFPDSPTAEVITPSVHDPTCGAGRHITLAEPMSIRTVLEDCSKRFNLPTVRYALGHGHIVDETLIRTVAICVGSGASVFSALSEPVDLLLTGEMTHHDVLKAVNIYGSTVILTEHTTMERLYMHGPFVSLLQQQLGPEYHVEASSTDKDPVGYFTI